MAYGDKTKFVQDNSGLSGPEVVAKAKEAGIEMTLAYVQATRTRLRRKDGIPPKKRKSKLEFVLARPSMTAAEIVSDAKEDGLKMTEKYVAICRAKGAAKNAKKRVAKAAAPVAKTTNGKNGVTPPASPQLVLPAVQSSAQYAQLFSSARELGLSHSIAALQGLAAAAS